MKGDEPMEFQIKDKYNVDDLREVVRILRAPGGCPWDREQTHESIRTDLIEETYEVLDAIDRQDVAGMEEERGDLLMQVVFHSRIAEEAGRFDLDDVADGICKKLIYRHPHVFADTKADTSEEVLKNWDALKRVEKSQKTQTDALNSVPRNFPALIRASKLQKKAGRGDWDWGSDEEALTRMENGLSAVKTAMQKGAGGEEAIGALLFAVVQCANRLGVDCEQSLTAVSNGFLEEFAAFEEEKMRKNRG